MVLLGETDKFIPENLNNEKVVIFRRDPSTNNELKMVKDLGKLADPSLLKPPDTLVCNYVSDGNPLHEHTDGTWWFYEETWAFENGPYLTYEDGYDALEGYCIALNAMRETENKDLTASSENDTVTIDEKLDIKLKKEV